MTEQKQNIFICHASKDEMYVQELLMHLKPTIQGCSTLDLRIWEDSQIFAGSKWHESIQEELSCSVAGIIVVSEFLFNSEYVMNNELPKLLTMAHHNQTKIFCIYARESMVEEIPFSIEVNGEHKEILLTDYQWLNSPDKCLEGIRYKSRKSILIQCVKKMLGILRNEIKGGQNAQQ